MKLTKNYTAEHKEFWDFITESRAKVEKEWPEWKKNVKVTKYSNKPPEQSATGSEKK